MTEAKNEVLGRALGRILRVLRVFRVFRVSGRVFGRVFGRGREK